MGTYTGTSGADTITPSTVSAGVIADPPGTKPSDAADAINSGGGGDTVSGGGGNDYVYDVSSHTSLVANAGNVVHGDAGNDYIYIAVTDTGGANPATNAAWGDSGDDSVRLVYDPYNEDVWQGHGPTGTITLHGGAGSDTIDVSAGYDTSGIDLTGTTTFLYGDAGNDFLRATLYDPNGDGSPYPPGNPDHLYGGPGNDSYEIFENKDVVVEKPGEGYDTVTVSEGDYLTGGNAQYILPANVEKMVLTYNYLDYSPAEGFSATGNALDNVIVGTDRNERLDGQDGNDTIYGGIGGSDTDDRPGVDIISGGAGNDTIYGGNGNGHVSENFDGADRLYGDDGNDRIFGSFGDDRLFGGPGDDSLAGQAGNDVLYGGLGNDHLGGGSGDDTLYGEDGNDVLTGRGGADSLYGWYDEDRFVYESIADSKPGAGNHDTIFYGTSNIDLAQIDADTTKAGNQAFTFVGTTPDLKAGQLHVVAGGAYNNLIQGEVDGKPGVDFEILVQDTPKTPGDWTAGDFIL